MKNRRIIKETITKDQAIAQFKTMNDSEKMGWIKAMIYCVK